MNSLLLKLSILCITLSKCYSENAQIEIYNGLCITRNHEELRCQRIDHVYIDNLAESIIKVPNSGNNPLKVNLSECDIDDFPDDIFYGISVGSLTVTKCLTREFPRIILSHLGSTLKTLIITESSFPEISETDLQNMKFATNLEILDLSRNGIKHIHHLAFAHYESLKSLNLDYNRLSNLNENFLSGLKNLQNLSLRFNQISMISGYPFNEQIQLVTLDLSRNKINSIQLNQFKKLRNLKNLYLDGNCMSTNLTSGSFAGLEYLKSISLWDNPFQCDCNLQWLKEWLQLRGLTANSLATCAKPRKVPFDKVQFCLGRKRFRKSTTTANDANDGTIN